MSRTEGRVKDRQTKVNGRTWVQEMTDVKKDEN